MRIHARLLLVLVCLTLLFGLSLAGCTKAAEKKNEDKFETIPIKVTVDELYDMSICQEIGVAKFKPKEGSIGSRIEGSCFIETLSRFPDQKVRVKLELLNQDAAREMYPPLEWEQDTNEKFFYFVIPLVETIPTILNFRLLVYEYIYDEGSAQTAADDDTTPTVDDDTTPADDDTAVTDDDTLADDDTSPVPSKRFEAEAVYLFVVNQGQPGAGD